MIVFFIWCNHHHVDTRDGSQMCYFHLFFSRSYISDSKSESYVRCCVVSHKFSAAISAESEQTF